MSNHENTGSSRNRDVAKPNTSQMLLSVLGVISLILVLPAIILIGLLREPMRNFLFTDIFIARLEVVVANLLTAGVAALMVRGNPAPFGQGEVAVEATQVLLRGNEGAPG